MDGGRGGVLVMSYGKGVRIVDGVGGHGDGIDREGWVW